ncbi:MAG: hypothetical protein L6R28_00030 [Planctomycetes bacterium]|nr:hypothetical protein [Planctomycetota bacterium]
MPYGEPDPEDPLALQGIEVPGSESETREMARCFAEEFARMGWATPRILQLFQDARYAGPYRAFLLLGEKAIREIVAEAAFVYGVRRQRLYELPETLADCGEGEFPPAGPLDLRGGSVPRAVDGGGN